MAFCQPSLSPGCQQQAVVGRDPLHLLGGIDQQAQVHSGFYMYLNLVVLTNKRREGKYWFKSGCPTPDPRWPAVQQLMVIFVKLSYTLKMDLCQTYNNWNLIEAGPIPGDCDYRELRTAFLSHGQTCHLFIQNNQVKYQFYFDFVLKTLFQAWLERNQEKFGSRQVFAESRQLWIIDCFFLQVKFGYVVFTEAETAERLYRQGSVVVRRASGERIQVGCFWILYSFNLK